MIQLDAATALALISAVALLIWLILRLCLRPIEQRMDRWEVPLSKIKGEEDLKNMIRVAINEHKDGCHKAVAPRQPTMSAGHVVGGLCVAAMLAWAVCGCRTNPLVPPAEAFLATVGAEYLEYVESDPELDENARRARRANVQAFRWLIEEGRK